MALPCSGINPLGTMMAQAEVAELVDALDSKSSGASPRAGSIPAFGIGALFVRRGSSESDVESGMKLAASGKEAA
jgi:hypothetical protein